MRSRLGTLLVRQGLLTPAQHLTAVEQSEELDQPLITSLLGLGFVSEDRLVEILHKHLLVPVASPGMLTSPPTEAILAIPARMALEFLLCPCGQDTEGSLLVAMADATDTHALDEVTYHSGRRVVRFVASLSAIRWAIGHHYGLDLEHPSPPWGALPDEDVVLLTKVKVPGHLSSEPQSLPDGPSQTLAGPVPLTKVLRPTPSRLVGSTTLAAEEELGGSGQALEADEAGGAGSRKRRGTLLGVPTREIRRLTDPSAYSEEHAPRGESSTLREKFMGAHVSDELLGSPRLGGGLSPSGAAGLWSSGERATGVLDRSEAFGQAMAALRRAQHRDDVGRILLQYFEAFFLNVLILVVRQRRLVGWRGGGIRLLPGRVEGIDVDLSEPSTLRDVVSSRLVFQGPLGRTPQDAVFEAQLGYDPGNVLLVPIQLRLQVIGLLCADSLHTRIFTGEVEILLGEVGKTYEALATR